MCFGIAAAVGIPSYLLARSAIGNTGAITQRGAVRKEDAIAERKKPKARPRKGR